MTALLKRCPGYSLSPRSKLKGLLHKYRAAALFLAVTVQRCGKPASNEQNVENLKHQLPLISRFGNQGEFFLLLPRESTHSGWRVQTSKTTSMIAMVIGECINFLIQRNFVFRSKGNLAKQIGWYVLAFCIITCIVNSINCIWVAVAGLLVPDFIYNIGTTVLNGGISMVIFFFVNKIIFPEGEKAAK